MRTVRVFVSSLALVAIAGGGIVGSAGVAGAGAPSLDAPLTIKKVVSGPVPAGTTFTVTVTCDGIIDGPDHNTATVTFDATGTATSANVIGFDDPGTCTVTETTNGGAASVSYACEGSVPAPAAPAAMGEGPSTPCTTVGSTSVTVAIFDPDQMATVTVTNTFVAPTPTPTPTPTPAPVPASEVVVTPALTG